MVRRRNHCLARLPERRPTHKSQSLSSRNRGTRRPKFKSSSSSSPPVRSSNSYPTAPPPTLSSPLTPLPASIPAAPPSRPSQALAICRGRTRRHTLVLVDRANACLCRVLVWSHPPVHRRAMSPRQTSGPMPEDIQARMHGRLSPAREKNEEYDEVMHALSSPRLLYDHPQPTNTSHSDAPILNNHRPPTSSLRPPRPAPPPPALGVLPLRVHAQ
ncbi:hypothetical protein C0992_008021 [Termitomyces sp. T32_za158]|nr:hypothetical protein C0992_008021 [Termitomyces sp. T32_za158]